MTNCIWLVSQYSIVFLFRFVCIELVSLISVISSNLSCNLCSCYYNQLVHFDKEINANVYRHSLWEYSTRFHCSLNGIWHLMWRYLSKPVLGGHPVLSRHYSIPQGCPLNTGFTVLCFFCFMYLSHLRDFLNAYPSLLYTLLLATRLASSSLTKPL